MNGLFDNDPVFKKQHRDSKGRYATAEHAMYDKAIRERGYLEFQVEKYRRQAEAVTRCIIIKDRQTAALKARLAELQTLLNQKVC